MKHSGISSFSVILTFVGLSLLAISFIPLLSIQFTPSRTVNRAITVNFQWPNASARTIEEKVTSKLEGLFSTMTGLNSIESVSTVGSGYINLTFDESVELDMTRFEIAMLIRQIKRDLPFGVSYPSISVGTTGSKVDPILTYTFNGSASPYFLQTYAEKNIRTRLSLPGVREVSVSEAPPFQWEVEFKNDALNALGIRASEIRSALTSYFQEQSIGKGVWQVAPGTDHMNEIEVKVTGHLADSLDWRNIPIRKIDERIVYLRDVASVAYRERLPASYSRVNGLNSIVVSVLPEDGANTLELAKQVRAEVKRLRTGLPPAYSFLLTHDSTKYLSDDLQRIAWRTVLSVALLSVIVWLTSRSLRYLFVIVASLAVNLLIACMFYYVFDVDIHLYSLAGITISFGIIIDNSLVMIEHLRVNKNRNVFLGMIGATLTTMAALSVIFFLKAEQQRNLIDLTWIILINLGISLGVAYYLIPALMDKINLYRQKNKLTRKRAGRIVWISGLYKKYVRLAPRYTWVFVTVLVLGFGVPLFMLPDRIGKENQDQEELNFWERIYNKSIGSDWFEQLRPVLEKMVGGTLRIFAEDVFTSSYYGEPGRIRVSVTARMPEGSSVQQMNETVVQMENLIARHKEVELFETKVNGTQPPSASVEILFKPEFEFSAVPFLVKNELENKAMDLGGADWSIRGFPDNHFGQSFTNSIGSNSVVRKITLEGYNYEELYDYATQLTSMLDDIPRVSDPLIVGAPSGYIIQRPSKEFYVDFNEEKMAAYGLTMDQLHSRLAEWSFRKPVLTTFFDNQMQSVWMVSDRIDNFRTWNFINTDFAVDSVRYKMGGLAIIDQRRTGNAIYKSNQQYRIGVSYNFVGSYTLEQTIRKRLVDQMNATLPLGYTAHSRTYNFGVDESSQYYLLGLIIALVFLICAILFESLRQPFAILMLIPFPFIGVFLTFWLFEINFDQGGYASFVLLIGLAVNAGIFVINDYNNLKRDFPAVDLFHLYAKAFNHKVITILLTIFSTVIGLVPFLWGGQNEVFWYAFAAGTIGGLMFSFVGVYFFLPVFLLKGTKRKAIVR